MGTYIGHTSEEGRQQLLIDHLKGTGLLAERFASIFDAAEWGKMAGLYHDIGKYSTAFQQRILEDGPRVDHSTAGALLMKSIKNGPLALCIASHHSGLLNIGTKLSKVDDGTLMGRLKKELKGKLDYSVYRQELPEPLPIRKVPAFLYGKDQFYYSFFIRMLFSCLVDADFLDTERFVNDGKVQRGGFATMQELHNLFFAYYATFGKPTTPINQKRQEIYQQCLDAAEKEPGMFSLTVPTGGGKTLSSLAFALKHAIKYKKQRIIYIIPYTSIIEQTADIFRNILGNGNVIEHHMNVDYDDNDKKEDDGLNRKKLATENWDAPVIVTTNVQFFESLFAAKTSRCRKVHNIANSVLIFDEAQMLPEPYLRPCIRSIGELAANYRCTAVLCTATQPSLETYFSRIGEGLKVREICPDTQGLYEFFRRAAYRFMDVDSLESLAVQLKEHEQVLCVTNSKKDARDLYQMMSGDGCYHLSTFMYPAHRRHVLAIIRQRLQDGLPCQVISTSLIQAGVDVDFPVVYREIAGLDSIIQTGGRCNREGKQRTEDSIVYIYDLHKPMNRIPAFVRRPIEITQTVVKDYDDIASAESIKAYFDRLHYTIGEDQLDSKDILKRLEINNPAFTEIAKDFKLIEEDSRPVFIPIDGDLDNQKILVQLRAGIRSRSIFRKANQYIVSVYKNQFEKLCETGKLDALDSELYVLNDPAGYDSDTGLVVNMEDGIGIFL
ncbi:CRISPR-associated helicase Cas3' [uncultured Megasphaera sp.]|jgi:CRISPR-associated endonuclease/helicase Cas3|uniref:CRISPR-associated helicase Cas3' n=1 Tax=uncultured Megasphaera sp. TaxID=165188 RepID=UPI0025E7D847|nr:CRISPR-associated helicase Cas3' [uncultured Megasphaera sp.]